MDTQDVVVIGAGPAGVMAAVRAAELGARTTLVTRGEFGGMAANDGPVPVRTLAQAARLIRGSRNARSLRNRDRCSQCSTTRVCSSACARSSKTQGALRRFVADIDRLGVTLHERAGNARFVDAHTIETESGLRMQAERIILCAGGMSRRLSVPGAELTATHSDAWSLKRGPAVDAGHRRGHDRSAGRVDFSGVRLAGMSLSASAENSAEPRMRMSRPPSLRPFATLAWWCGKTSASSSRSSGRRMAVSG